MLNLENVTKAKLCLKVLIKKEKETMNLGSELRDFQNKQTEE